MKNLHFVALLIFLICIPFARVFGSFFEQTTLKTDGKIVGASVEDLNDDGLLDILAISTTGHPPHTKRWLSVFWQHGEHRFDPDPDQTWEADPRAAVIDVGEVSPDPGREIVFLAGDGIDFYGQKNGTFVDEGRRLIGTKTMFALAEDDDLPAWDFARDICPDAGDEILIPGFGEVELWSRGGNGDYQLRQTFQLKMNTRVYADRPRVNSSYSLRADYRVPKIGCEDFNRDGRTDIVVCWEDNLDVFLQKADGTLPTDPNREFRMELRTEDELEGDEAELLLSVHDLNGDGYMDVVANKTKGGLANATTQTSFYMGQAEGTLSEAPDHFMTAEDAVSEPYLVDLNGDGRLDLIQPQVKMGIKSVISMLLMKKFDINFLVYLNRGEGLFSEEPDYSTKVGFKIDFSRRGGSASPLIEFEGDYNGDGRKDLAVGTSEEELSVFFGDKHKVFPKKPQVVEKVKTSFHVVAKDFDGDGKTELLLYYPDEKELKNQIVIFWPK